MAIVFELPEQLYHSATPRGTAPTDFPSSLGASHGLLLISIVECNNLNRLNKFNSERCPILAAVRFSPFIFHLYTSLVLQILEKALTKQKLH